MSNIRFNHDTSSSSTDALNIRQDYSIAFDISNGEWIQGVTNLPACYTTNKSVTIKAKFVVSPSVVTSADIWGTSTDTNGSLGSAIEATATFANGTSSPEWVSFDLGGTTPDCVKKTTTDVWQWRADNINGSGSPACDLNISGPHTVYTVLGEPVAPWENSAGSQRNAWAAALDFVIVDAGCNGDASSTNALSHIAQYLHGATFAKSYDTTNGESHYAMSGTGGDFNFSDYMQVGGSVNCYDQAAGVTVCARLLGISPEYVFVWPFGYILQTDLVGVGACNNPFFDDYSHTNRIHDPLVDGGTSDRIEYERSSFNNHAVVRFVGKVSDATCGPHVGTESLVQYATSAIDISSIPERGASPDGTANGGDTNGVFSTTEIDAATELPADVDDIH